MVTSVVSVVVSAVVSGHAGRGRTWPPSSWPPSSWPPSVPTYTIVAVAFRAFAAYYALWAVLALRTSKGLSRELAYATLAVLMAAITVLAKPAS